MWRRERRARARLRLLLAAALAACGAAPAGAQIDVLSPAFRDLNGGVIWGSLGHARGTAGTRDDRPMWRGGFAAFYGPFGGSGDTVVVFTRSVTDSSDTTGLGGVARRHHAERTTTLLRAESRRPGRQGKVLLAIGYEHSAFQHFGADPLPRTLAMGGIFLGGFLGPYRVPGPLPHLHWYGGIGGTIVQLEDVAARVDTLQVSFTTERTVAPEVFLMLGYPVARSYRVLLAVSYQYVRFGSIAYRSVEAGRLLPTPTLATLPSSLRLESVYWTAGVSFTANALIPK